MRQLPIVIAAIVAGFIGGAVGARVFRPREEAFPSKVVRANSFELLNDQGTVVSMWGTDKWGQTVMAFANRESTVAAATSKIPETDLKELNRQRVAIGLLGDGSPFVTFRGKTGEPRVRLYLNEFEKPALIMNDENGVRMGLGVEQSDTPSATDNDWVLSFYPDRSRMGMLTERDATGTYVRGFLAIHKDRVKYPR